MTTPAPLSTLPPLKPGETWLYNRRLRAWQPAPVSEVETENARLLRVGLSPLTTGAPPAGAKVWGGKGYATYQPETT